MRHFRLLLCTSVLAIVTASVISFTTFANTTPGENMPIAKTDPQLRLQHQEPTYYILELEADPIATYTGDIQDLAATDLQARNQRRLDLKSDSAEAYASHLEKQQSQVTQLLSQRLPEVQVERTLRIIMNAVIVKNSGQTNLKGKLAGLPGVKRVYENEKFYTQLATSNDLINAPEVWELIGSRNRAGEGVNVAVIDTGINSDHEMFADNGHSRPQGLPDDDYCATLDPAFCNDKLVLARYYAPLGPVHPDEYLSPEDSAGHGSHVAGIAVGNAVTISYNGIETGFSGVAPGANLMVYKALYVQPDGRRSGHTVNLLAAMEDAVADGADIINNSWGSSPDNPQLSPYRGAYRAAEEAGVLVVTSAGNSGPVAATISCPACIEEGIAVASTQHGRTFGHFINAAGVEDVPATVGTGEFSIDAAIEGILMPAYEVDVDNDLACEPFPTGSFDGVIGFVQRGDCEFEQKANNLQNAGAVAMVLWNNQPGVIDMSMGAARLPGVSISQEAGETIIAALNDGNDRSVYISPMVPLNNANAVDAVSRFSSRGPNFDASFLKPDIAAPGSDILSAIAGDNDAYGISSGTSMASPHVAGAAALVRQLRPELNAVQLKSVLMTSANPNVRKEDMQTPADWFDIGAGRLDVAAALETALAFEQPSLVSTACVLRCTFERMVTNLMDEAGEWYGRVEFRSSDIHAELSSESLELDAQGNATFHLHVDTRTAEERWHFGQITWTDASGQYPDARLPIALMAARASDRQILDTMVTSGTVTANEPLSLRAIARGANHDGNNELNLVAHVPDRTELVTGSVSFDTSGAQTFEEGIIDNGRAISWAGILQTPEGVIESSTYSFTGLSLDEIRPGANSVTCETYCDEVSFGLNLAPYGGFIWDDRQVDYISISENGFIAVGAQDVSNTWRVHELPNEALPAGVIAPLWADFEVGGDAGGNMLYNVVNVNGEPWFVWEWNNVSHWGDESTNANSFSVWIKLGTDVVVSNYIDVPASDNYPVSVGIESVDGQTGRSLYFGDSGLFPQSNNTLRTFIDSDFGHAAIDFEVVAPHFGSTSGTSVETMQDETVTIDLSELASTTSELTYFHATLSTSSGELQAVTPISVTAVEESRLVISGEPEHGTAIVDGFQVTYHPDQGFHGSDSFSYQLVDEDNNTSASAIINVLVGEANEPPVASASVSSETVRGGATVVLSGVESSDPNGDALMYSWRQTSGPSVELSGAGSAWASFTAPNQTATLTFQLTVSDGEYEDTVSVSVDVERKSSRKWYEGSLGALITLLGLPVIWMRRRRANAAS